MKGDGSAEVEDVEAAAALPHAMAPVEAQALIAAAASESCITAAAPRSLNEATGRRKKNGEAAAALPPSVAPAGALSVYS